MRLRSKVVAVSAAVLLAATACSGSGSGSGDGGDNAPPPTLKFGDISGAMDATAKGPAKPIPGATKGGVITVLGTGGNSNMDPSGSYSHDNISILGGLVTRTLTQYVHNPETGKDTLVPDLATDVGRHNKDFTKWTFTLRKGIKFENGKPVTPEDIKYGIMRSFDRKSFPNGANYSNLYFADGDTYTGPYGKDKGKDYKGVTIDGMDITIKMSEPFPGMPYWAAYPAMGPIPSGAASAPAKYALHPLATGPYKFKSYTPDSSMVLVKNPEWDAKTDPGRRQLVDEYHFNFAVDSSQIDQTILQDHGKGQTTVSMTDVQAADYYNFKKKAPTRLATGTSACTFFWEPDNRKITDINVRRALGWAYPYKNEWSASGNILGVTRIPAVNPTPPGVAGRTEYNPLPGHKPGTTDPAKAKALLKKAGKLGYTIRWPFNTDLPQSVAVKNVVVPALKEAGFNPQPLAVTSTTVSKVLQDPGAKINVRPIEWCPDWPSGGSFLPAMFYSTNVKDNGFGSNYSGFKVPAVDKKMDAIPLMPLEKQDAAWDELEHSIMAKHYPVIPLGYSGVAMMRGSKVQGFYTNGAMPNWATMWVEK